jgi:ribonuclease P protein component
VAGRLGRRAHFDHLGAHGTTVRAGRLRIVAARPLEEVEPPGPAVAFAIGRPHGSAVARNRLRRRLRAVVAATESDGLLPPRWFLVSVAPSGRQPGYEELDRWFRAGLRDLAQRDRRAQAATCGSAPGTDGEARP